MSALALKLPFDDPPARPRPHLVPVPSTPTGPATLDRVMSLAWTALAAGHPAECPICTGTLVPAPGGGGACRSCGSSLS